MPRYFFDIRDSKGFYRDEVGDDFVSFEDACRHCQDLLPDIARDELQRGALRTVTCDVRDDENRIVYRGKVMYEGSREPV